MASLNQLPDFSGYGYQLERIIGRNRQGRRIAFLATEFNGARQIDIA